MHSIAAKAVCFGEAMKPEFVDYARRIVENAKVLAEALQSEGFRIVSGGTDNHLLLVDVGVRGLTGKAATLALEKAGIVVNRNTIPYDTRPPLVASGLRMGTPALTTRGFGPDEMRLVARFMARVLADPKDESTIEVVRREVEELSAGFPVPGAEPKAVTA